MDKTIITEALSHYELSMQSHEFIRQGENTTMKITDDSNTDYLLRINSSHAGSKFGILQTDDSLAQKDIINAEMLFLNEIGSKSNIALQAPVKNKEQKFCTVLDNGSIVTLLSWIHGTPLHQTEAPLNLHEKLGENFAELFKLSEKWENPAKFKRYSFDEKMILKLLEHIKSGIKSKAISEYEYSVIEKATEKMLFLLNKLESQENKKGIAHCDIARPNLVLAQNTIIPIDFSLCGLSYIYMDIASFFVEFENKPEEWNAIKKGYEKVMQMPIDLRFAEPFTVLRFIAFIGIFTYHQESIPNFHAQIEDEFEKRILRFIKGEPIH